ncbi:hypothetical protein D1641_00880 [Colidextribacter sp. OB.20]|uniref:hypothetical protein n=1 Tax=Colidextribacter sp. OB.20 TaxID=2304568 RepID=UPI00136BFE1A|nr:hypothetical protein [Colidextribacter sp. OB.20]NBI08575.1 hypothetical protein [Colidextribacter sp. OB.20]
MKIYSNGKMLEVGGGSGGGSSLETYSTEEQRIGTWIDGKPLYRKTYSSTTPNALKAWADVSMNPLSEVDQMLFINSRVDVHNENLLIFGGSISFSLGWNKLTKRVRIYNDYSTTTKAPFLFTLYYTKVTDRATIDFPTVLTPELEESNQNYTVAASTAPVEFCSKEV